MYLRIVSSVSHKKQYHRHVCQAKQSIPLKNSKRFLIKLSGAGLLAGLAWQPQRASAGAQISGLRRGTGRSLSFSFLRITTVLCSCVWYCQEEEDCQDVLQSIASFWKSRQQANISKLLAPIEVSIIRLQQAKETLKDQDISGALQLLRQASLNCYIFDAQEGDSIETKVSLFFLKDQNCRSLHPEDNYEERYFAASCKF
eukprot:TRINITY_DN18974_c0_g1_i1.p2 TRINITY_DN18974_c0_g1~~TRINITY_DN18974_c0_g1_i1.p2  ORF type:complete len:200 (-),score=3.94 TRINITY_DN18974_c0_g1_i1:302-901(-)